MKVSKRQRRLLKSPKRLVRIRIRLGLFDMQKNTKFEESFLSRLGEVTGYWKLSKTYIWDGASSEGSSSDSKEMINVYKVSKWK